MGGIHFHLIVVLPFDAKTGVDFEAFRRRDYSSASPELRSEWEWWRCHQESYGLGRHELLPIKTTGERAGKYLAKYVSKTFENREARDFGARYVRYFGHWSVKAREKVWVELRDGSMVKRWERMVRPPMNANHGTLHPAACAWRARMKQVAAAWNWCQERLAESGEKNRGTLMSEDSIARSHGPRWAWGMTKRMSKFIWIEAGLWREAIGEFNRQVSAAGGFVRGCWEAAMDEWGPWVTREKLDEEWETARLDNANVRFWRDDDERAERRRRESRTGTVFRNGTWIKTLLGAS
jgi:hypothetical protein